MIAPHTAPILDFALNTIYKSETLTYTHPELSDNLIYLLLDFEHEYEPTMVVGSTYHFDVDPAPFLGQEGTSVKAEIWTCKRGWDRRVTSGYAKITKVNNDIAIV